MKPPELRAGGGRIISAAIAILNSLALLASLVAAAGCGGAKETAAPDSTAGTAPARSLPVVRLTAAELDLSGSPGKIEKDRVDKLASILRREKVDILAVQGITRYPTLRNRTDFVDELAAAMEFRQVFGETINLSGRETGNAVFSSYPINSSDNRHFEGLSGTGFESAIHALIDVGVRDIAVVSTRTPENPAAEDRRKCETAITSVADLYNRIPVAVFGNLTSLRPGREWEDISPSPAVGGKIWYTGQGLKGSGIRSVETPFGTLVLFDLEISGRPAP